MIYQGGILGNTTTCLSNNFFFFFLSFTVHIPYISLSVGSVTSNELSHKNDPWWFFMQTVILCNPFVIVLASFFLFFCASCTSYTNKYLLLSHWVNYFSNKYAKIKGKKRDTNSKSEREGINFYYIYN